MSNELNNNMEEEKKMKTVKIEVFGYEEFLEPKSTEDYFADAFSRYAYDHLTFNVDGTEYTPDDFSPAEDILSPEQLKEFKDFDVEKFFEESEAEYGMIYINKAWTTIELEIPEDEEFDPKKAAVVVREFLNLDSDYCSDTVCAFAYDGKIYDCNPEDSNGVSGERIWVAPHKWGYIDKTGAWIVEPKFEEAYPFSNGRAKVQSKGKYGFIDTNGAWVCEPKFDDAKNFHDGLAAVKINDKWGFIDTNGAWVCEPKFDDAKNFHDGLAAVKINDKWGFIDKKGKYAIEPKYYLVEDFNKGEAYVLTNKDEGITLIDRRGNILFGPKKISGFFAEGLALCRRDDKYGFIDKNGAWVIQPIFDKAWSFADGMARVTLNDKYGYINTCGKIIIEPQFKKAWDFDEGIATVESDNKYGWIDKNGAWVINPRFDGVADFQEGLAIVIIGRKYGYIDTKGEVVIKPRYDLAWNFHEGVACTVEDGKAGFIDKTGNWVIEPKFEGDEVELDDRDFEIDYRFSEGFAAVTIHREPIPDEEDEYEDDEYDDDEDYDDEDYDDEDYDDED